MNKGVKSIDQLFQENETMLASFINKPKNQQNPLSFQQSSLGNEPFFNPEILNLQTQNKLLQEHVRHLKDQDLQRQQKYDSLYHKYNFIMQLFLDMLHVMNENASLEDLKSNASFHHLFNKYISFAEKEGHVIDLVPTINEKQSKETHDMNTILTAQKAREEYRKPNQDQQQTQTDLYEKVKDNINVRPQSLNQSIEKRKRIFDDRFL